MKKTLIMLVCLMFSYTAKADVTYMVGVSLTLTGDVGFTGKLLSNDKEEKLVLAAGATYYPFSGNIFGVDASAGYILENGTVTGGWDFIQQVPQFSLGFADTED
ncbi:MAG: hypothetical protein KTR20_10595 [Cellvibrionaceae bacterium]|nr:hypothetical protein [Cellvibrionaceae bacterium]